MTPTEWKNLGLYSTFSRMTYEAFENGNFLEFIIRPDRDKSVIVGKRQGVYECELGTFATKQEAEIVSLTLRMLNPA